MTFNVRYWDEIYDPVWDEDCMTISEKHLEFLEELWYRLNSDGSWTCIKGKRKSIQVFLVSSVYCKKDRDYILTQLTESQLLNEPRIFQQFSFENSDSI